MLSSLRKSRVVKTRQKQAGSTSFPERDLWKQGRQTLARALLHTVRSCEREPEGGPNGGRNHPKRMQGGVRWAFGGFHLKAASGNGSEKKVVSRSRGLSGDDVSRVQG